MPSQVSAQNERGLRLLSIDGGGIRGLSPLLMLKEILYRIQQENQLQDLPRPCDIFDLAGGTSTGGLIVIMLFRLQMSVDEAIDAYAALARSVFSEKKWFFQEGTFRASRLEDAIVSIVRVRSNGDPRAVKMLNEGGPKCFVCAMLAEDMRFPALFRSWVPSSNPNFNCSIVQAARATTAAPTIFKAIEFGHPTAQRYLDGGLRCNNPVKYVVEEARSLYPGRAISCVLSLGTGTTGVIGLERPDAFQNMLPTKLIGVLRRIATDCDEQSETMAKQLYEQDKPNSYFRLNVNEGLQHVSLAEWSRMSEVAAHTVQYLRTNDVGQKVEQVVKLLNDDSVPAVALTPTKDLSPKESKAFDNLKKAISHNAFHDSRARSTSSGCLRGTRVNEIRAITDWIDEEGRKKPLFVVKGPAGSGKTSLLNTVTETCKSNNCYAAGFFFSGTDPDRNNDAYFINTIAYQIAVAIPELQPYMSRIIAADDTILTRSLDSQTKFLLLEPLRQLRSEFPDFSQKCHSFVIVVDALGECGNLVEQRRVIAALAEVLSDESFPFVCLLSSRFNLDIEHEMSTTLAAYIHDQVVLGTNGESEQADIRAYLCESIDHIRENHTFGKRIPQGWPTESDLQTIVKKSGGQFIYASTVMKYVESPKDNPHERLRVILGISATKSGEDPFAELDALYRVLMSSVENLSTAIQVLGIHLVRSRYEFWTPRTVKFNFDFQQHFHSLDADIALAPLTSVLKYEDQRVEFYHLSFSEFLLDHTRSGEFFVNPKKWQKWIVSQFVPFFYNDLPHNRRYFTMDSVFDDVKHLIKEAKPGTDLQQAISDGFVLVPNHPKCLGLLLFVTYAFFAQLQINISIDKMDDIFVQQGENFILLAVLIKLPPSFKISNSFLLFELCRTCGELQKVGYICSVLPEIPWTHQNLPVFMGYLAECLDNQQCLDQGVPLPQDYLSATLRCLWYLQSSSNDIRSSLTEQFRSFEGLPKAFGISSYLKNTSSNLTRGALGVFPTLLNQTPPSINLFAALKQPFDDQIISRTPLSFHNTMHSIHDYLMQYDTEYQQGEYSVLAGLSEPGEDEPLVDVDI